MAEGRIAVQRLTLQIGERHGVKIQQRELTDARRRQILRSRAAEPTQANHQHPRGFQLLLTIKVETAQDDLPVVAQHLLIAEFNRHYSPPNRWLKGSTSTHSPASTAPRSRSRTIKQLPRLNELKMCDP